MIDLVSKLKNTSEGLFHEGLVEISEICEEAAKRIEQLEAVAGTEWFWRIVDANGLADLPSDEEAALRLILKRGGFKDADNRSFEDGE